MEIWLVSPGRMMRLVTFFGACPDLLEHCNRAE
jgi:hypothetical protein